jgi:hypothetical protein
VIVRAGQHRGAARAAERIGRQAAVEPHPLGRQPVDVRGANQLGIVSADGRTSPNLNLSLPRQRK